MKTVNKKIRLAVLVFTMLFVSAVRSQDNASVFSFLNLPSSSHATALGGQGASIIANDVSLCAYNPALMMSVENRSVNLNFMTYMQGTKVASAGYVQPAGEHGSWGAMAQFLSYGSTKETDIEGNILGTFTPIDLQMGGGYSRALSERWAAGATGKFIYSRYGSLSSLAIAVDIGLNYYIEESEMSLSLTGRNIGVQLKAFGEQRERLPFAMELSFAKGRVLGVPLTLYISMVDLTRWSKNDYYNTEVIDEFSGNDSDRQTDKKEIGFGKMLINHFVIGADYRPVDWMWIGLGYNFRRGNDLKAAGSSHAAGLTLGAGIEMKKFSFGFSWAKYHVSASSLCFTAQYNI